MFGMTLDATDPAAPTVLDVEASGFGRNSYPIEIGFVLLDGHAYCTLVRPAPEWTHWDAQAEATHHISRSLILERGLLVVDVARRINTQLRDQTVYSDGWAHDYSWSGVLFDCAAMQPSFKLQNLRALLDEQQADRWHQVKAEVSRERARNATAPAPTRDCCNLHCCACAPPPVAHPEHPHSAVPCAATPMQSALPYCGPNHPTRNLNHGHHPECRTGLRI